MDQNKFIEKMQDAKTEIDAIYCEKVIRNSLRPIDDTLNQPGCMNLVIVMEELAELQQAISKSIRGKETKVNLIEELADTYLGIKYVQEIFNISDETLAKAINVKLDRQNERNSVHVVSIPGNGFPKL